MQVSFTSNSTGTVTGHAAANVTFGGETFHVETAGLAGNSGDAVKRFVNAKIAIAPDDVNRVGESHTFTVTLSKDTVTVTIDLSNLNAVIPEPFVDVKLFKLIVITCNESTDTLVDSEVALNGVIKDTITTVPAHLPITVTEHDMCAIGGASYGALQAGVYTPAVELPDVPPLHP